MECAIVDEGCVASARGGNTNVPRSIVGTSSEGMRFQAIGSGPLLSREAIQAYESANGLSVPDALKRQLLDQNGGAPVAEIYIDVADREEELMSFFGIDMHDASSEIAWVARTFD